MHPIPCPITTPALHAKQWLAVLAQQLRHVWPREVGAVTEQAVSLVEDRVQHYVALRKRAWKRAQKCAMVAVGQVSSVGPVG